MWIKEVSEAQGMGWNGIREIADGGKIHLRTHWEEPELDDCNDQLSQAQDVLAPEIAPASLRPIVAIASLLDGG